MPARPRKVEKLWKNSANPTSISSTTANDWNKPSIDFYLSLGAKPMSDWTVYRISGDTLASLAD